MVLTSPWHYPWPWLELCKTFVISLTYKNGKIIWKAADSFVVVIWGYIFLYDSCGLRATTSKFLSNIWIREHSLNTLFACLLAKEGHYKLPTKTQHYWCCCYFHGFTNLEAETAFAESLCLFVLMWPTQSLFPPWEILKSEEQNVHFAYTSPFHSYINCICAL